MATPNRRAFLLGCGTFGIGIASTSLHLGWDDIRRVANETPLQAGSGVLVILTMYGGNDGISTVIPYENTAYYDARPELAYLGEEVIDLDGTVGLNPGMSGMANLFHNGSLAIVRGVGYPDQDRSHFRSMDIWQAGSVDSGVTTGWIGRLLDNSEREPLRAISVGGLLPTLAVGSKTTAATLSLSSLAQESKDVALMASLAEADPTDSPYATAVRSSFADSVDASKTLKRLVALSDEESAFEDSTGDESLRTQFQLVSRCIRAGLPTQVYCVSIGGFDTHSSAKSTQEKLLRKVDNEVSKFLEEISGHENGSGVVVMAYSEFGRRVAANASDGTDHGTSGPVFIAGAPVKGGFYGDDPSLTDLTQGDLKTTTDFRDVYAELLAKTLGTDPDPIVGAKRKPLGFLA